MGGALWKEFYLNILSKLRRSSKILFKQLRCYGFYPLGKSPSLRFGEKTFRSATFKKHPDEELKNIALRAGWKGIKGFFLFY